VFVADYSGFLFSCPVEFVDTVSKANLLSQLELRSEVSTKQKVRKLWDRQESQAFCIKNQQFGDLVRIGVVLAYEWQHRPQSSTATDRNP